jgi:hypothetical protein
MNDKRMPSSDELIGVLESVSVWYKAHSVQDNLAVWLRLAAQRIRELEEKVSALSSH